MDHVWVFNGATNRFPSAVFLTREQAEEWITLHSLDGTLTRYPVGTSVFDWAVAAGAFTPKGLDQSSAAFVANFSSASLEHYHYENGGA